MQGKTFLEPKIFLRKKVMDGTAFQYSVTMEVAQLYDMSMTIKIYNVLKIENSSQQPFSIFLMLFPALLS
jgi:hypothetical protein